MVYRMLSATVRALEVLRLVDLAHAAFREVTDVGSEGDDVAVPNGRRISLAATESGAGPRPVARRGERGLGLSRTAWS